MASRREPLRDHLLAPVLGLQHSAVRRSRIDAPLEPRFWAHCLRFTGPSDFGESNMVVHRWVRYSRLNSVCPSRSPGSEGSARDRRQADRRSASCRGRHASHSPTWPMARRRAPPPEHLPPHRHRTRAAAGGGEGPRRPRDVMATVHSGAYVPFLPSDGAAAGAEVPPGGPRVMARLDRTAGQQRRSRKAAATTTTARGRQTPHRPDDSPSPPPFSTPRRVRSGTERW